MGYDKECFDEAYQENLDDEMDEDEATMSALTE